MELNVNQKKSTNGCVSESADKNKSFSRFRKILSIIISFNPRIFSIKMNEESGDINFSVLANELGISIEDHGRYSKEIYSNFFVNFLGELLVRENVSDFVKLINQMDYTVYFYNMEKYIHKNFGMKYGNGNLVFSFHISFLQKILTEDFKHQIKI